MKKQLFLNLSLVLLFGFFTSCGETKPKKQVQQIDYLNESRTDFDKRMKWWRDARFGMFIHWGPYAVPAGIHKGEKVKGIGEWIMLKGNIPIEDYEIEPETGKDIVTTLDVFIQEVTENALMKMMVSNEATNGCAIVMETKSGKIKAIANLGRTESGNYTENFNYAINPSEPGSTFKLVTMISLLEDKKINLNSIVNLQGGKWDINGKTVFDSEQHGRNEVTVKQAFELSSNVGIAKMAYANYNSNPSLLAYASIKEKNYNFQIMTSRGCPHRCCFCSSHSIHGRSMRYYNIDRVKEDLIKLKDKYHAKIIGIQEQELEFHSKKLINYMLL